MRQLQYKRRSQNHWNIKNTIKNCKKTKKLEGLPKIIGKMGSTLETQEELFNCRSPSTQLCIRPTIMCVSVRRCLNFLIFHYMYILVRRLSNVSDRLELKLKKGDATETPTF